jgi:DNA-binding beta-propeller fold protein YncE
VSAYQINQSTGALTALSTPTYPTGNGPQFMSWDPTGTYMYIANDIDGTVTGYTLGASGALGSQTTTTVDTSANENVLNVAVAPNGSYLYVVDGGNASASTPVPGSVYGFTLTSGVPSTTPITGTPQAVGLSPTGIAIDPTSSLLAVDNAGTSGTTSTISLFTIGAGGALTTAPAATAGVQPYFVTFYNVP